MEGKKATVSYLFNTVNRVNLDVVDAHGQYLITRDGNKYVDWFMDSGVTSLGYRPWRLMSKLSTAAFPHLPNTIQYEKREEIAGALCALSGMSKVFFSNSGTEAIETAIKVVRKWNFDNKTGRDTIYCLKGGFHGRTLGSLAASSVAAYHRDGFGPLPDGFETFFPIEDIDWKRAAAILLEPIQGSNDARELDQAWMRGLFVKAATNGVPIIFDEIQTGAFRIGKFTASKLYGIQPDIICLGKGIGCGFPIGITLVRPQFNNTIIPGTHYSTFGGSPMSLLGVETLLDTAAFEDLGENVLKRGKQIKQFFSKIGKIKEIRGRGLMLCIELVEGVDAFEISKILLENGMFLPTFRNNRLKLAPPLNMSDGDVLEGVDMITKAFEEYDNRT